MSAVQIIVNCAQCGKEQPPIRIEGDQLMAWRNGAKAQHCFPQLTASERELLISNTCDACFNEMFPPEL